MLTDAKTTPRRKNTLRRSLLPLLLAGVLLATGGAYRFLTNPDRIRQVLLERFDGRNGVTLGVASAAFSLFDGVTLDDVSLGISMVASGRDTAEPAGSARLFCPSVQLTLEPWSVIWGPLTITAIAAHEPTVNVILGDSPGTSPIDNPPAWWTALRPGPASWPAVVELRDADLRLSRRGQGEQRTVDELTATVRARRSDTNPGVYDVVWSAPREPGRPTGQMQVDLDPFRVRGVRGGLPPITIQALMLLGEQRFAGAAQWSDRLALSGAVRARNYAFERSTSNSSLELELNDISLSIPVSEQEIPLGPDERYLRFHNLSGVLRIEEGRIAASLDGRFQDSLCSVRVTSQEPLDDLDSLDDLALGVQLSVQDLYVPANDAAASTQQRRFIDRWPGLARWFREFEPNGVADIELGATLRGRGDPALTIDWLRVAATDADVRWRHIAYPLSGVEGTVLVERDGPVSVALRGRRKSADVGVDINMERPDRCARAEVRIRGHHVPVDQTLLSAVPAEYRDTVAAWRPEGATDLSITLQRPACTGPLPSRWRSQITAVLRDVSGEWDALTLSLRDLTGTLLFGDGRVELDRIQGTAAGGNFRADGTLALEHGRLGDTNLALNATGLRFGQIPPAAFPEGLRRFVTSARPAGAFDLRTELSRDAESGHIVQTSHVTLKDVSLSLGDGAAMATGVQGTIVATEDDVRIDGLTFRLGDATVRAAGTVNHDADRSVLKLDLATEHLSVDAGLTELLPGAVRDALKAWQVDGAFDVQLTAERDTSKGARWRWRQADVKLHGATVTHAGSSIPLTRVEAELTWDDRGVRVPRFRARYNEAVIEGSLARDTGASVTSAVVDVRDITLDSNLRNVLPPRVQSLWDRLVPRGTVDLQSVSVECHDPVFTVADLGPPAPAHPICSVKGELVLRDLGLGHERELEHISGTVTGSGRLIDADGGVTLGGTLSLDHATAWHRKLHDADSSWALFQTTGGTGSARMDGFQAESYGGAIAGEMEVSFDAARVAYGLQTTWQGVDLAEFIAADPQARAHGAAEADVRGLIDAQAYVTGVLGDATERRGGGRIELRDGHLYRLPLILAILHVLNLSSPENDVFEDAATSFYVVGREVRLSHIVLRNESLALVGSGTMSLPDRGVDLKLINAPTHMLAQLPILTDLLRGASRELMELQVTGPLYRPTVRARPLRALTDEIRALFQKRRPATVVPGSS